MSNLKDIFKKLNEELKIGGNDKLGFLSEMPEDFLSKGFTSTGSAYLDYITKGHNNTGLTLITGWESSGKSSLLLTAVKEAQISNPDKKVVIVDSEGSITKDYMERMGVNPSSDAISILKSNELERSLDIIEEISRADDVSLIGIDSIKAFYSTTVEDKSAEDNTIGIEAKRFNARMPIIKSNCFRRGVPLICVHQWRENPGALYGDNRVLSGGKVWKYMPDLHIDISKGDLILDKDKSAIGHVMRVRVKKSKHVPYNSKNIFEVNFYYDYGFDNIDEYASIFIEEGIIIKSGAWFAFPDNNGEEVKLQGKSNVVGYLKENEDNFNHLLKMLKDGQ